VKPKTDLAAYKLVLDDLRPQELPHFISNKIDDKMIITISKVVRLYVDGTSAGSRRAFEIMSSLSRTARFSIALLFLTSGDLSEIEETFDMIQPIDFPSAEAAEEFSMLRKKYSN